MLQTGLKAVLIISCLTQNSCSNNIFNPHADLKILAIQGDKKIEKTFTNAKFKFETIGIFQSFVRSKPRSMGCEGCIIERQNLEPEKESDLIPQYEYIEPQITIHNREFLPRVTFRKMLVKYDLGDIQIASREFLLNQTLTLSSNTSAGEQITLALMSRDSSLQAVLFPGNSEPRLKSGKAMVTLMGEDFNGNPASLDFSLNLSFRTTGKIVGDLKDTNVSLNERQQEELSPEAQPTGKPAKIAPVNINTTGFEPSTLTLSIGDQVTWTNNSGKSLTLINTDGLNFKEIDLPPGGQHVLVFDRAGSFRFRIRTGEEAELQQPGMLVTVLQKTQ